MEIPIETNGYMHLYVANESMADVNVHFPAPHHYNQYLAGGDDMEVTLIESPATNGSDYYPFGLAMDDRSWSSEPYRFGYQGQFAEKDEETGWNAFELRMYNAIIGRWMVPDPYRQYWSPYLSMGNNPINRYDPDGGKDTPNDPIVDPTHLVLSEKFAITATQTWADKLWYSLWQLNQLIENGHGYQYMSEHGSGQEWNKFARNGIADNIIMDPTSGIIAFKGLRGRQFKWDGKTPISKGDWEIALEAMDFAAKSLPTLQNGKDGVGMIFENIVQIHAKGHGDILNNTWTRTQSGHYIKLLPNDSALIVRKILPSNVYKTTGSLDTVKIHKNDLNRTFIKYYPVD